MPKREFCETTVVATEEPRVPNHDLCAICLETLKVGQRVQPMVRCQHLFHESCIADLIKARWDSACAQDTRGSLGDLVSCPLCRGRLAATSISEVPELERSSVVLLEHAADEEEDCGHGTTLSLDSAWGESMTDSLQRGTVTVDPRLPDSLRVGAAVPRRRSNTFG